MIIHFGTCADKMCSRAQVNLGVVKERLEAHPMTVFTESDVRYELGAHASFTSSAYAALPRLN